jgi:hypothetical protein
MTRLQLTFLALIVTQAVHSVEEYVGRLYEVFPPARFVSGLASADLEQGFIILNVTIVGLGLWCFLWPVRQRWASSAVVVWVWTAIELLNGIGHPAWSLLQGGYTPGVATAPVLFALALSLAHQLRSGRVVSSATA